MEVVAFFHTSILPHLATCFPAFIRYAVFRWLGGFGGLGYFRGGGHVSRNRFFDRGLGFRFRQVFGRRTLRLLGGAERVADGISRLLTGRGLGPLFGLVLFPAL